MKRIIKNSAIKTFLFILALSLFETAAWAQDAGAGGVDIKVTKDGSNWYAQPWVWIIGGAVFILLLVALLRGNSNKD